MDICEKPLQFQEQDRHPWELARLKAVESFLKNEIPDKPCNILDLGCGDVFVAQSLSRIYKTAAFFCVDIAFTPELIELAEDHVKDLPIRLYPSLEDFDVNNKEKIDIVLLLDVIEHIEDPVAFLQELHSSEKTDENTKILITVPAFMSLFTTHDVFLKHFRRYNLSLLNEHINSAGFESKKEGFFFFSLLIVRILQKFLRRNRTVEDEKGIGGYQSKGLLDQLMVRFLYLDFLFAKGLRKLNINLPGLSCFTICQKQPS